MSASIAAANCLPGFASPRLKKRPTGLNRRYCARKTASAGIEFDETVVTSGFPAISIIAAMMVATSEGGGYAHTMEQIARLLFATTVVTIFMYLLVFTSIGQSGNGGEYWGFDGFTMPEVAAHQSFDDRDYRFLEISFASGVGNRMPWSPNYRGCDNHPFGAENSLRPSAREPMHGCDSERLAREFAARFNERMASLLRDTMNGRCEQWVDDN